MKKIYTEHANGRDEFWTYADGDRVYLSENQAVREITRGRANLVEVQ